jgi:hypothetical protein
MGSEMVLLVWAQVPFDAQPLVWLPCLAFASKQCVTKSLLMFDHDWLDQTVLPHGSVVVYQLNNPDTWPWHVRSLSQIRGWTEPSNSQHVAALKALHPGADSHVDELMKTALECAHSYAAAVPIDAPAAAVPVEVPAATVPAAIPAAVAVTAAAAAAATCVHTAPTAPVQLIHSSCSREHILQQKAALAILPVQANSSIPAATKAAASIGEAVLVAPSQPEAAAAPATAAAAATAADSDQQAERVCTLPPSGSANADGASAADSSSSSSSNSSSGSSSCSSSRSAVVPEEALPDLPTLIQQGRLKAKRKAFRIVSPKDQTAVVTLDLTKAGKLSGGNIPAAHVEEMMVSFRRCLPGAARLCEGVCQQLQHCMQQS